MVHETEKHRKPHIYTEGFGLANRAQHESNFENQRGKPAQLPTKFPWESMEDWTTPRMTKKKWVKADTVREETKAKRRDERDPNHPRWIARYSLLTWWGIRITLVGSDPEGRQVISIRKGQSEPIYIRVGTKIELFRAGKKIVWD